MSTRSPILVSACLLGLPTRYDGRTRRCQAVLDYLREHNLQPIPVCPEQLAGLATPREQTRFVSGDGHQVLRGEGQVVSVSGASMNEHFCRGAKMVLQIARLSDCRSALLKERSPSCGVHQVYLGEEKVAGAGVTTALLLEHGIEVISEEEV